jgi:hypothetical protein
MSWQVWSVIPVWVLAIAAAVVIGATSPADERVSWIAISLAAALIVTFIIQLAIRRKEGFVVRVMASVGGAMVVLAIATLVLALTGTTTAVS